MQKLRPLIIEASDGKQAPWFSANLRKDTQKFSLSGKFAIEGGEKNDNPNFRADLGGPQTVDSMLAVLEAKEKVAICQGGELTPRQKLQLDKLQAQAKAARVGPLSPFRAFYKKHKATFFTWVALGQVLNGVCFQHSIPTAFRGTYCPVQGHLHRCLWSDPLPVHLRCECIHHLLGMMHAMVRSLN
jgi:hypothetical protein